MAIDLARLSQSELLQVVNATPLGVVLTRPRLRRQMDAGAFRFGDGQHIHLVRYVRWLIGEHDKPRPAKIDYIEARRRQAEKNRAATKASQDIAPIPQIEDLPRRQGCGESFRLFCETYFPIAFHRTWSDDHLRVIGKIERAVREGGLFAFAMPRGSGKTTLARCAALWAAGVEVSPSCGSIMTATSLDANIRGQQHTRVDGSIIRPSLVLLDDPQTRESARSVEQTRKRLELLNGDVMGMAGPGETISSLCTCTVMYESDLADTLLDREKSPEWDSERTKLVHSWPTNENLWDQYAETRRTNGSKAANQFYANHRVAMDAGAAAASMCGVKAAGEVAPVRERKRYSQDDLRRRA